MKRKLIKHRKFYIILVVITILLICFLFISNSITRVQDGEHFCFKENTFTKIDMESGREVEYSLCRVLKRRYTELAWSIETDEYTIKELSRNGEYRIIYDGNDYDPLNAFPMGYLTIEELEKTGYPFKIEYSN